MAANSQRIREIEALIGRIEASRRSAGAEISSLRAKLDAPRRAKKHLLQFTSKNPIPVFGGMLGAGFLLSRFRRRPKPAKRKRGVLGFILGAIFAALKPTLMRILTAELRKSLLKSFDARRSAMRPVAPTRSATTLS
ncbi:hypothetical protein HNR46_001385 [Haloferula luteola]|uniref:DUF3618 domain-containing protein n=1 Tax=Haloferula luteola TaxID=595692 RepID=A0A840VE90_9BACT|nr:hypothetical protein [Haloferula luteola]MBB5351151.1 hypothetical protein [Haloferula luteola]